MKKVLLTFILALMAVASTWAYDVEIDGIYYNLDSTAKTAQVTAGEDKYTGSVVIPESITADEVIYSVTSIRKSAFRGCNELLSVAIPNSVTSIGDAAFLGCSSLTSVELSNNLASIGFQVFESCENLASVDIPNSVTEIKYKAFTKCNSLTSVTIPNSVITIGTQAFWNCM